MTFAFLLSFAPVAGAQRIITTVAGGGPNKVPALQAGINAPHAVFKDSVGNLYVAAANGSGIYKIDTTGTLTRIVGNGSAGGYSGDGGPATNAELNDPYGVFVDSSGNIFIDGLNNRIRKVVASTGIIQTVSREWF